MTVREALQFCRAHSLTIRFGLGEGESVEVLLNARYKELEAEVLTCNETLEGAVGVMRRIILERQN
jgi:hypothetical protein